MTGRQSTVHSPQSARLLSTVDCRLSTRFSERRLLALLRVLGLALSAAYLGMLLYHVGALVRFPYDLNYGEGYVLNDALRLVHGQPIYTDIRQFPMVRSPYPPGFLVLDGLLTLVLGTGFAAGRLLSVAAALASGGLIYLGARRLAGQRVVALVCAGLYLGSPFLYQWAGFSRVDLLANALALAAVVLLLHRVTWRHVYAAAVLCVLALCTKQTAVAAPLAIVLALLLKQRRQALAFALAVAVPTAALTLALNALTDGQYGLHVWLGNAANPFNLARLVVMQVEFLVGHSLLVAAALWLALGVARGQPLADCELRIANCELPSADAVHNSQSAIRNPQSASGAGPSLAALYAVVAFATTLSVGNEGSSINYFLEFLAAAALAAAAAWAALQARLPTLSAAQGVPLALAVLQLGLYAHAPNAFGVWPSFFPPHGFTPTMRDEAVGARLDELVRAAPGPALLEPAGLAVRNGKEVLVQPIDLRAEQHRGRWQPDELNRAIAERRFALIVLSFRLLPHEVLAEVERHYRLVERLEGDNRLEYRVYRPAGEKE
ncbi:MAG: glycosyltransferase family 39 protein [Chloroflexi bacterium]|nr:glycosyltransferase family 39 protein [Chloroflexota bacterium]